MAEEHEHLDGIACPICKAREEQELAMMKARQTKWVQWCTMIADCLNRLRIIPRVIVAGYAYLIWHVTEWFMALPSPDTQQAALVTTVVGAAGLVFGFYMQGGITNKGDKGN